MEQIRIVDRRVATGASGIVLAPQHGQHHDGVCEAAPPKPASRWS